MYTGISANVHDRLRVTVYTSRIVFVEWNSSKVRVSVIVMSKDDPTNVSQGTIVFVSVLERVTTIVRENDRSGGRCDSVGRGNGASEGVHVADDGNGADGCPSPDEKALVVGIEMVALLSDRWKGRVNDGAGRQLYGDRAMFRSRQPLW
jgi:hypothetical protein